MSKDYLKDLITKVKEQKKSEEDLEKKKMKKKPIAEEIPARVPEEAEEGIEDMPERLTEESHEEELAVPEEKDSFSMEEIEEEPISEAELRKQKGFESKLENELKVLGRTSSSRIERGSGTRIPGKAANESEKAAEDPMKVMRAAVEEGPLEKSTAEKEIETASKRIEVASYGEVKIYKIPGKALLYYMIPVPRPTASEKAIINTVKEVATRLISIAPYRIRDPEQRRIVYKQQVMDILKSSHELRVPERRFEFYADAVVREMVGYGIIDPLVRDDKLEEIMVIGPKKPVFVFHREYEMMTTNIEFYSDNEVQDLVNRIARQVGRRVDMSSPLLDARLPDGSRVNATLPPASVSGTSLTIRKFREDPYSIVDLMNMGTVDAKLAAFLWLAVEGENTRPANILISGGTGSGKTTTLNVLASFIPQSERIISIEDTAELSLPLTHWIRLESKPPGLEGKGEITLDILTKNSLRMRPDRIIMGEIRHDEAFSLFTAFNTGHDGCLTGDVKLALVDGIEEIGEFVDGEISKGNSWNDKEWEVTNVDGKEINCLNSDGKIVKEKIVEVRRKPYAGNVMHLKLASGQEITITPNHPFYKLRQNIEQINAQNLKEGEFIATPRILHRDETASDAETEYWSGLLHGDGHILDTKRIRKKNNKEYVCNEGRISLYTEEERIIPKFINFMKENFDDTHVGIVEPTPDRNCYEVRVSGSEKAKNAIQLFDIPSGSRAKVKVSNAHYQSSLNEFVAGFFDAEGHVDLNNHALVFTCGNEYYIDFIKYALLTEGIVARKYESKSHNSRWYRLYIYGINQVANFAEKFPLKYPEKIKKLNELLSRTTKTNTNVDVIPCNEIIENKIHAAKTKGISEGKIAKEAGISQGMLRFIRTNQRMPSVNTVKKLANAFEKCGIDADELKKLSESDVFWDKIVAIHEFDYTGFVYDLTVSETEATGIKPHNFVANGIIVGNSLGTVHANSSHETIVRVTSPPMNVPEIMLSGLDIILVQHRLHDKKKGTIRRVTEIAEVSGVLEGHAQTQTIFERDPVDDTFSRTNIPSLYLKKLQDFTGMTKKQLDNELSEREMFLETLMKKNIRDINDVSKAAHEFLFEKKEN